MMALLESLQVPAVGLAVAGQLGGGLIDALQCSLEGDRDGESLEGLMRDFSLPIHCSVA